MSKFTFGQILGCLLLMIISASTTLAQPIILNATEAARPGDLISLQGSQFGTQPQVWFQSVTSQTVSLSPTVQLKIVNSQASGYVAVTIPSSQPLGLYAIWISDGTSVSDPVFINQARGIQCEYPALSSGYAFRIFGRSLMLPGAVPNVTFVDINSGAHLPATVITSGSNPFVLNVKAPAVKSGARYKLILNNGFGGTFGDAEAEETVAGRNGGADPFALNVPWGADFGTISHNSYNVRTDPRLALHAQGNGRTNDRDALQAAIDTAAAAGGGTVYLPAGTYCVDYTPLMGTNGYTANKMLLLKTGVVLRGDGLDSSNRWRTIVRWGFTTGLTVASRPHQGYGITFDIGSSRSGITGICCQNLSSAIVTGCVAVYRPRQPQSELFLTNSEFDIGNGSGLILSGADTLLLQNTITVQNGYEHTWDLNQSSHYWVRGNSVVYSVNRLFASQSDHLIFENNHITRDGDNFPSLAVTGKGTGGLSSEQSSQVVVINNTFDSIGAPLPNYNDGETILSEWVSPNRDTGTVTSASAASLQDTGKRWTYAYGGQGYIVAIVRGAGMGQTRLVTGNTATGLTLDRPWDIVPAPGDRYTLLQPSAQKWLVKDNILQNVPQGIMIYESGLDCTITGNSLINGGQIFLRADQKLSDAQPRFQINWNMRVEDNTVSDTDGQHLGSIAAWEDREDAFPLWGVGLLCTEFRRNTVTAYAPTSAQRLEGFGCFVQWAYSDLYPANDSDIGVLGTIFQDNLTKNAYSAYYTGTGASATTVWNAGVSGTGRMINDNLIAGAAHASSSTVIGAPPAGLQAAAGTGASSLNWQPVTGASGYQVYRAASGAGPWNAPVGRVSAPGYLDAGLSGGSQYYYVVKATYGGASSAQCIPSGVVGLRAHMSIPVSLIAAPGAGAVYLRWQPVLGASSYNIYRGSVSSGPYTLTGLGVSASSFVDDTVSNGQKQYYVVSAVNAYEETARSAEASATAQTSPDAPSGLNAKPGSTQITVSWNTVSAATSYYLFRSETSGSGYVRVANVSSTSAVDTGLVNGQKYYYVVRSVNQGVEGSASSEVSAVPVSRPAQPNTLSVKVGNGVLTLTWNASSGADNYIIYRSTAHGGPYTKVESSNASPYSDSTVSRGTTYYYVVTAASAGGESPYSTEVSGLAPAAPARPVSVSASLSGTQVMLSWPASAGATGYTVYQSRSQSGPFTQSGSTSSSTTRTITGLRDGTYYYVVTAENAGGESAYSPAASVTLAPIAPANLAVRGGTGLVTLLWTASPYTSLYRIYRAQNGSGPFTSPYASVNAVNGVATPTFIDTKMTPGTTYYYVVRAVGVTGLESASSSEVSARL